MRRSLPILLASGVLRACQTYESAPLGDGPGAVLGHFRTHNFAFRYPASGGRCLTSGHTLEVDGPYGWVKAIREQIKNGVDHIKLNLSGGIMGPAWDPRQGTAPPADARMVHAPERSVARL